MGAITACNFFLRENVRRGKGVLYMFTSSRNSVHSDFVCLSFLYMYSVLYCLVMIVLG
jgi:hypothetical protein